MSDDKRERSLPVCDCLNDCGDDRDVHKGKARPCKMFIEQSTRTANAAAAKSLLTELGVIDQYDGAGLVAALIELRDIRSRSSGSSPVQH